LQGKIGWQSKQWRMERSFDSKDKRSFLSIRLPSSCFKRLDLF
jgi:hypothetical protein